MSVAPRLDDAGRASVGATVPAWGALAVFLAAFALRPSLFGLGPLFPEIQEEFRLSHAVAGLLATIPVVAMGLIAPLGGWLSARFGWRLAFAVGLGLVTAAGLARSLAPTGELLILLTVPLGLGIGIGGAVLPVIVKERFEHRAAFATGVYSIAIQVGSTLAVLVAVPLAALSGGWRGALVVFALSGLLGLVGWRLLGAGGDRARADTSSGSVARAWRSPLAWLLAIIFWLASVPFYGLVSWLAPVYIERGWSPALAGALVAAMSFSGLLGSVVVGWTADRVGSRRATLAAWAAATTAGIAGFLFVPDLAWLWAVVTGISLGATFTLALILPLDVSRDPGAAAAIVGLMFAVGYLMIAATPAILGLLRDVTGSFGASIAVVMAVSALLIPAAIPLDRRRLHGH